MKITGAAKAALKNALVFGFYTMVFIILTWPLAANFGRAFLGSLKGYRDLPLDIWLHWLVSSSIKSGTSFLHTGLVNYPSGFSLIDNVSGFLLPAFTTIPSFFLNLAASYNFTLAFFMILSAFSGYLLASRLSGDKLTGLVSGFIFGFNPFVLNEVMYGRMYSGIGCWIALYALFLIQAVSGEKKPDFFLALGMLIMASLTTLYYGLFLVIFTLLFLLYWLKCERSPSSGSPTARKALLVLAGAFFFIVAAYGGHILKIDPRIFGITRPAHALWLDSLSEPLHTAFIQSLNLDFPFRNNWNQPEVIRKISFLMLLIASPAVIFTWKKSRFWLACAASFLVLALGPYLKISGNAVTINKMLVPLPYLGFHFFFPFFNRIHWPTRFISLFMLALSVLCGFGFQWLGERLRLQRGGRWLLAFLIMAALTFEMHAVPLSRIFPAELFFPNTPPLYQKLAAEPGDFAIIELPADNPIYMQYQTIHGKKIFSGPAMLTHRYPAPFADFISGVPLLNSLYLNTSPVESASEYDLGRLRAAGFRYIVVDRNDKRITPGLLSSLEALCPYRNYPGGLTEFELGPRR